MHFLTGYPGPVHLALPVDIMFSSFAENVGLQERSFDRTAQPLPRAWSDPDALAPVLEAINNAERPVVIAGHGELDYNHGSDMPLLSDPGAFLDAMGDLDKTWDAWFDLQVQRRTEWVKEWSAHLEEETAKDQAEGRKMHPLQLGVDVQAEINDSDWLVFVGGNTHFWNEIATNIAAKRGLKLGGILHPGNYSLQGVGVSFGLSAKNVHPDKTVVVISGDGAFLSGGLSVEACFRENPPIVVVIDNNGGLDCISRLQEKLFGNGQHYATDFRDIPFHTLFEGMGGYGEMVTKREELSGAIQRAIASRKAACVNVKCRGVISPIVAATAGKRDKASIE
ncbi:thiamine pyrophosphate-dependent enzyme [Phaeobacter sp. C3_T13_0]|uniref:thiamine pyrophosphate-dependent enzyme n=1 Tax=Phaeobacter cretensis TaxID=3342641 RepID=UPI0039BCAA9F